MTARSIADRRYRIALHASETGFGAGGRPVTSHPLIANVWAARSDEDQSLSERGDKQTHSATVTFITDYLPSYMRAKHIRLGSASYRVTGVQKSGILHPMLQFSAQRNAGD